VAKWEGLEMPLFGRKVPTQTAIIDLRERRPEPRFGYPTPCPECGANGYLDSIDINEQTMYQHCPTCFAKWTTSEQELAAAT
jgi:hypothetical protein